jgi:hypothetical protein
MAAGRLQQQSAADADFGEYCDAHAHTQHHFRPP